MKTARAAWSYFKKQKYGRIVNITGQWGINGQASHTTAEFSLVGFTETLAKEGSRNNIIANLVISRPFASNLVISLAAILTYQSVNVNGAIFDIGFDSIAKLQWKRSKPVMLKADTSLTASAVLKQWEKIGDFSNQDRNPDGPLDGMELLRRSQLLPTNASGEKVDFGGQVAIVTGAGNGYVFISPIAT
jgi:multifunctional beta-oxidation protein